MGADEARLLRDHREARPGAADELARRALRIALRTATAMLGDRDLAADIAQDTAIDVLRGAHRINDPASLDAWIHRIASRHALRAARRTRGRLVRERPLDELEPRLEADGAVRLQETVEQRELTATVRDALATLPAKQRLALVLRYVHDMSYDQIADAMGERSGTVGALISRGKAALRTLESLADRHDVSGGEGG